MNKLNLTFFFSQAFTAATTLQSFLNIPNMYIEVSKIK